MMKDDDFKLLNGFALGLTNGQTNGQTFAIVESLSRLKIAYNETFAYSSFTTSLSSLNRTKKYRT